MITGTHGTMTVGGEVVPISGWSITPTTEEDAFHAILDKTPDDHTTRLVFADWLEERDDPRAAGYRALGMSRVYPWENDIHWLWFNSHRHSAPISWVGTTGAFAGEIPKAWFMSLPEESQVYKSRASEFFSRREAEDEAALAFARLTPEEQAAILAEAV